MSTRGWYEYYVVDAARAQVSLALQFYKWGDATPENAVGELRTLQAATRRLGGRAPVQHVKGMLRDNLQAACDLLPESFALGCYYFLLQRAAEEDHPFRRSRYADTPKEDRPDYQLGLAVGRASGLTRFEVPRVGDAVVDGAHFSIEVGTLVRRWSEWGTRLSFLRWIQLITQVTETVDMGSIAGDYERPFDVSFLYRFSFHVPALVDADQPIAEVQLELCTAGGAPLLEDKHERKDLKALVARTKLVQGSLEALKETHTLVSSPFWRLELPRGGYLGP